MNNYGSGSTYSVSATADTAAASLARAFGQDPEYRAVPSVLDGIRLTARVPLSVNGVPVKAATEAKTDRKRTNRALRQAVKLETPAVPLTPCVCSQLITEGDQTTGCSAMVVATDANEGYAPGHIDLTAVLLADASDAGTMIYNAVTGDLLSAADMATALGYELSYATA